MSEIKLKPVIEERFEYKGFPCVVMFQPMGFRTGYVGLPKGHKYYGGNFYEIPVDCHCGLTYSRYYLFGQADKDTYWIGFDCAHICDKLDIEKTIEYYGESHADRIREMVSYLEYEMVRSFDYVKDECKSIVDQLGGAEDE